MGKRNADFMSVYTLNEEFLVLKNKTGKATLHPKTKQPNKKQSPDFMHGFQ